MLGLRRVRTLLDTQPCLRGEESAAVLGLEMGSEKASDFVRDVRRPIMLLVSKKDKGKKERSLRL